MSAPGNLVEYLQSKRLICALCLRSDHKDNLYVRTEDNREDRVAVSKVVLSSPVASVTPQSAPEDMVALLREASSRREEIASQINLEETWELLVDEDEEFALKDLAGLVFGSVGPEQLSGLYRALANDKLYFQRKGDSYRPRSRELVAESQTRLKTEGDRAQERDVVGRWLRDLWNGGSAELPAGFEKAIQRYLTWIREVALTGPEASRFKDIAKLFKELDISGKDAAFRLMVRSGQWSEDENLLLQRFHTPIEFPAELEEEARGCRFEMDAGRKDLRHLTCITVDDADTTEIDDALSIEETESGFRVGVHIADASAFIERGSPLDREARERGTAVYLPERKIRMLPESLGDDAISLVAGHDRPSFTFLVEVDRELNVTGHWMGPALIHVQRRCTYEEADAMLDDGPWAQLLQIARALRARREAAGAVTLPFPRTSVKVDAEKNVLIERESPSAPSQVLVSEMMILANSLSGEFLSSHSVPALFRSQPPPDKPIPPDTEFTPETLYKLRRLFRRGEIGLVAARHNGLGLDAYTQATSPIRRYSDLVMQRQLKSMLATGEPLYTQPEIEEIAHVLERSTSQADLLEKDRRAYWTLRYLEERRWHELDAIVLQNLPDKHIVQIVPVLWETDCPLVPRRPLPPGTRLKVRIELVWPREQLVRVTPVVDDEKE